MEDSQNLNPPKIVPRSQFVDRAKTAAQMAAEEAVSVLVGIMNDPKVTPPARIAAARKIYEFALEALELDQLEARIQQLESLAGVTGVPDGGRTGRDSTEDEMGGEPCQ